MPLITENSLISWMRKEIILNLGNPMILYMIKLKGQEQNSFIDETIAIIIAL
jgi:hypothetical protein